MQTNFFNTTALQGDVLLVANKKACHCADYILKVFKEYPNTGFTPFDVQYNVKRIYGKDFPVTSIRARMTVLTNGGTLIKSHTAEGKGIYKVPNHKWQFNPSSC